MFGTIRHRKHRKAIVEELNSLLGSALDARTRVVGSGSRRVGTYTGSDNGQDNTVRDDPPNRPTFVHACADYLQREGAEPKDVAAALAAILAMLPLARWRRYTGSSGQRPTMGNEYDWYEDLSFEVCEGPDLDAFRHRYAKYRSVHTTGSAG